MPDIRSKMASDIKRFMKDSRILELKEFVKVTEALPYMSNLTAQAQQKIERKLENHGECVACNILYEEVTRNPRKLFPELLAALKKTKQHDVYARFKATLHECRKEKSYKSLEEIMKLVKEEEAKKECERDSGDSDSDVVETDTDARKGSEGSSSKVRGDCGQSVVVKRNSRTPPLTKRPLSEDLLKVLPSIRDTKDKSKSLSSIKAKEYHELALCLQEENQEGETWWDFILCNTPMLSATRKEQRDIERSMCQGKAFLDLVESKGCSVQDLEEMLKHHGMHHGHDMLQAFRKADNYNVVSEPVMKFEPAAEVTSSNTRRMDKQFAETNTSGTVAARKREPVTQATEIITQRPVTAANESKRVVTPQRKVQATEITTLATPTEVQENTRRRGGVESRQTENKETQTEENTNDIFVYISLIICGFAVLWLFLSNVMVGQGPNIIIHIAK